MAFYKFVVNRLKAFKYAFKGAGMLIAREASVKVQTFAALLVIFAGFYFDITRTEWILQCLAIGLVLSIEGLNTAVEKIADFIHPDFHNKIGEIKDVAAGAVAFAAVIALVVGILIYYPYFIQLIAD